MRQLHDNSHSAVSYTNHTLFLSSVCLAAGSGFGPDRIGLGLTAFVGRRVDGFRRARDAPADRSIAIDDDSLARNWVSGGTCSEGCSRDLRCKLVAHLVDTFDC